MSHVHELVITAPYEPCSRNFMGFKNKYAANAWAEAKNHPQKTALESTRVMQTDRNRVTLLFRVVVYVVSLLG